MGSQLRRDRACTQCGMPLASLACAHTRRGATRTHVGTVKAITRTIQYYVARTTTNAPVAHAVARVFTLRQACTSIAMGHGTQVAITQTEWPRGAASVCHNHSDVCIRTASALVWAHHQCVRCTATGIVRSSRACSRGSCLAHVCECGTCSPSLIEPARRHGAVGWHAHS